MTILEIKTVIAGLLDLTNGVGDLIIQGQDFGLIALNHVRRQAELNHDFEFQRKLVQVTVDGSTGGSLGSAVLVSDGTTAVTVKSIIDMGLLDTDNNFIPVEWTTTTESLERQRIVNRFDEPRLTTEDWYTKGPAGQGRFTLSNDTIFRWPKDTENDYTVALEVYAFSSDWTNTTHTVTVTGGTGVTAVNTTYYPYGLYTAELQGAGVVPRPIWISRRTYDNSYTTTAYAIWQKSNATGWYLSLASDIGKQSVADYHKFAAGEYPTGAATAAGGTFTGTASAAYAVNGADSTTDTWTTYGSEYLIWGAVVYLNHVFKKFVFRQEGNLMPPEKMRDNALEAFKEWDAEKFELNRRHRR